MKDVTGIVETTGNVDSSNAVALEVSADGWGHIMSILSNMYSNKALAVLREYSCNARDSHIEAGVDRPIEVTLPSVLQPSLLIRDFGTGLTEEEVVKIFGTYGASTKRDTNEQVGAFGIGSKSAFTMGQQFVVTAVKDGHKTVALFALNEKNIGTVNIMQRQETTEPNGVLVSLAVDDVEVMQQTATEFFSTWPKGTVLVNGVPPESIYDEGFSISDEVHVIPGGSEVKVVMGAVGYPVDRDVVYKVVRHLQSEIARIKGEGEAEDTRDKRKALSAALDIANHMTGWSGKRVFLTVPIGGVDIAPSREALRDTNRTVTTLAGVFERLAVDLVAAAEAKIHSAKTWVGALRARKDAEELLKGFPIRLSKVQWRGKALRDVEVDLPHLFLTKRSYRSSKMEVTRGRGKMVMDLNRMEKTVVVTGVPAEDIGKVSRFARRFLEEGEYDWIIVSERDKGTYDWFTYGLRGSEVDTMTLDEYRVAIRGLRATAVRAAASEPSYSLGTYRERDKEDRVVLSEILDEGKTIALFTDEVHVPTVLKDALEDYTAVTLLATQSEVKFRERVADEVEVVDGLTLLREKAQSIVDSVTDMQRVGMAAEAWLVEFQREGWESVEKYYGPHMDEIVNDEFKAVFARRDKVKKQAVHAKGLTEAQEAAAYLGTSVSMGEKAKKKAKKWGKPGDPDKMFPLLPYSFSYWDRSDKSRKIQHGVAYLNGLAVS